MDTWICFLSYGSKSKRNYVLKAWCAMKGLCFGTRSAFAFCEGANMAQKFVMTDPTGGGVGTLVGGRKKGFCKVYYHIVGTGLHWEDLGD